MTRQEVSERITQHDEGVLGSFESQELQADLETCDHCRTNFGKLRQLSTALGKITEPSTLSATGKPDTSAAFRGQPSTRSRCIVSDPREMAAVTVRVALLVGIIGFFLIWTGVAVPTQRYQRYAVDFSGQTLLRGGPGLSSPLAAVIPRARLDLVIHLGLGNQPGPYDVVLVQDGMRYAFASSTTNFENNEPILRVKLDLSQVPAGESRLGIRPAGQEGKYYKVVLE
jgi:hypothetical protein